MLVLRMAHRIWKETKQLPGTAGPGNMLGCCLISVHFLWAILSTSTVDIFHFASPYWFKMEIYQGVKLSQSTCGHSLEQLNYNLANC